MLELRGITKDFPGVRALDNVSVQFHEGEIHALLGENGAGKSTAIKVISGIYQPDAGELYYNGDLFKLHNFHDALGKGISIVNWPMSRLLLSYFASIYVRYITGLPVLDPTGGFKCFRREALESLDLDKIKSNGYCFQIEMNFYIWRAGFKIKEIPIIFIDRQEGSSKMSRNIVYEAIWGVWRLFFVKLFGHDKKVVRVSK